MPALKNPRHEQFCQLMFEGAKYSWSQGLCYVKAGFKATGHAAETSASRLLKNGDIQRRLAELGRSGAKKARVTAETLIDKLDVVYEGAVAESQYSAAGRAIEVQGKLAGVMTDRLEVGGPGAFAALETREQVYELMIAELGNGDPTVALAAIDEIRVEIEARAAARAIDVTPDDPAPEPRRPKVNKTKHALELFRPAPKGRR